MNLLSQWDWNRLLVLIPILTVFFPTKTLAKARLSGEPSISWISAISQEQQEQGKPTESSAPVQSGNQNAQPQSQNPVTAPNQQKPATDQQKSETGKQTTRDKAWGILHEALSSNSTDKRSKAVLSLGLMTKDKEAEKEAIAALKDEKANVRASAATALGSIGLASSKASLEEAVQDDDPGVMMACANAMLLLKDDAGYEVYYAVLTGEKKGKKGFISEQLATLKDKKKIAEIGLDEGIGFVPFAGIPYSVLKMVLQDNSSGVRAAAAKRLAHDPDPNTSAALIEALVDKNWVIRASALEALSLRDDRSLSPKIEPIMNDDKDDVRYRAAACILHLNRTRKKLKPKNAVTSNPDAHGR